MYNGHKILAVIPARGGSKGLPGKNIRELCGRPLIAWSIEGARQSNYVDELIVSTDSLDIANVAQQWGALVPFLRPAELATDEAKSIDVMLHSIAWRNTLPSPCSILLALQPTSPLRTTVDIDAAIALLFAKRAKAVVSVCPAEHHPWWMNTLPEGGNMKGFITPEASSSNRQKLPSYYRLNGALYLSYIDHLVQHRSFFTDETFAFTMENEHSVDIDSIIDFELAEILLKKRK